MPTSRYPTRIVFLMFIAVCMALLSTYIPRASADRGAILPVAVPERAGMSSAALARIDGVIDRNIAAGNLPGAVVVIVHRGAIVYRKAFGNRAQLPRVQANSLDTIYDLASMSKAVGTATAVMKLVEEGKIRLWDRVAYYDPPFAQHGKALVTVEELLTHSAGLPSALNEEQSVLPASAGEALIDAMPLHFAPGSRYEYCNTCFIELAKIVRVVSGESLAAYSTGHIFAAMGIGGELMFDPPQRLFDRISPEAPDGAGRFLRGRFMIHRHGQIGAEGHAGLFGTADALATYAEMLLEGGSFRGVRILAPATVEAMIRPRYLGRHTQRMGDVRGLGWDEASTDSSNRGELFGPGGFGHTGSTGCSLWIDPATQTAVIFLSNSAHDVNANDDDVVRLYGKITTIAAGAIIEPGTRTAMETQAANWSRQVAAQAPGFDAWSARDQALWEKTGQGTRY